MGVDWGALATHWGSNGVLWRPTGGSLGDNFPKFTEASQKPRGSFTEASRNCRYTVLQVPSLMLNFAAGVCQQVQSSIDIFVQG